MDVFIKKKKNNLKIVDTDLVFNDHFQQKHESNELLNNDSNEGNNHFNVLKFLSLL